jgi:hypothetical protein
LSPYGSTRCDQPCGENHFSTSRSLPSATEAQHVAEAQAGRGHAYRGAGGLGELGGHRAHTGEDQAGGGDRGAEGQRPGRVGADGGHGGGGEQSGQDGRAAGDGERGGQRRQGADHSGSDHFGAAGLLLAPAVPDDGEDHDQPEDGVDGVGVLPDRHAGQGGGGDLAGERGQRLVGGHLAGERGGIGDAGGVSLDLPGRERDEQRQPERDDEALAAQDELGQGPGAVHRSAFSLP